MGAVLPCSDGPSAMAKGYDAGARAAMALGAHGTTAAWARKPPETGDVLDAIRHAQETRIVGYKVALAEIRRGEKKSHWIWYVWPAMARVRDTSKPEFSLPDFSAAIAYLQCPVLSARLLEITAAAEKHLRAGRPAWEVLGSSVDAKKFHESMTFFAVAAVEWGDWQQARTFVAALNALDPPGVLDATTMGVLAKDGALQKCMGVETVDQLPVPRIPSCLAEEN
mmetsp:Transcript_84043/g.195452  ORF Transcript_84043/g.195452 Transcript_84043/m.195452 type:complete len:224 (+) Transcript_84043:32-703(+)